MVKTFTNTSDKPYDRHTYEVRHSDGRVWKFDDYMQVKKKPKDLLPKPVRPTRKNYNVHLYG